MRNDTQVMETGGLRHQCGPHHTGAQQINRRQGGCIGVYGEIIRFRLPEYQPGLKPAASCLPMS
jgi:hypothetical protein